jgi:hypothetical protein
MSGDRDPECICDVDRDTFLSRAALVRYSGHKIHLLGALSDGERRRVFRSVSHKLVFVVCQRVFGTNCPVECSSELPDPFSLEVQDTTLVSWVCKVGVVVGKFCPSQLFQIG